jgi:hypothetical protein
MPLRPTLIVPNRGSLWIEVIDKSLSLPLIQTELVLDICQRERETGLGNSKAYGSILGNLEEDRNA